MEYIESPSQLPEGVVRAMLIHWQRHLVGAGELLSLLTTRIDIATTLFERLRREHEYLLWVYARQTQLWTANRSGIPAPELARELPLLQLLLNGILTRRRRWIRERRHAAESFARDNRSIRDWMTLMHRARTLEWPPGPSGRGGLPVTANPALALLARAQAAMRRSTPWLNLTAPRLQGWSQGLPHLVGWIFLYWLCVQLPESETGFQRVRERQRLPGLVSICFKTVSYLYHSPSPPTADWPSVPWTAERSERAGVQTAIFRNRRVDRGVGQGRAATPGAPIGGG